MPTSIHRFKNTILALVCCYFMYNEALATGAIDIEVDLPFIKARYFFVACFYLKKSSVEFVYRLTRDLR